MYVVPTSSISHHKTYKRDDSISGGINTHATSLNFVYSHGFFDINEVDKTR